MTSRRRSAPPSAVEWHSPAYVAELLGLSQRTLREWRYFRTGPPFVTVGARIRYRSDDLEQWLSTQRVDTTT